MTNITILQKTSLNSKKKWLCPRRMASRTARRWNEWLAGVIDGDGYLAIQKNKVAVCEITMPLSDEPLLMQIKQKLGGRITLRSGAKAVRYRLSHKIGMLDLIMRVNGSIRNSKRVPQFKTVCQKFGIAYQEPQPLTLDSSYIAGFFDADGSVYITISKTSQKDSILSGNWGKSERLVNSRGYNQAGINISNKYAENLLMFQQAFGLGRIRQVYSRKKYVTYLWELTESEIPSFIQYTKTHPLRSQKRRRIFALKKYFALKQSQAHLAPEGTKLRRAWVMFSKAWYLF